MHSIFVLLVFVTAAMALDQVASCAQVTDCSKCLKSYQDGQPCTYCRRGSVDECGRLTTHFCTGPATCPSSGSGSSLSGGAIAGIAVGIVCLLCCAGCVCIAVVAAIIFAVIGVIKRSSK